jgi:hypothetical protein
MEKINKRKKSRKERFIRLSEALVLFASPDIYFSQAEKLQQVNLPSCELGDYICIVPEQIYTLARVENYSAFSHRSGT